MNLYCKEMERLMTAETENLMLKILQDMRAELKEFRADVDGRFNEVNERFNEVDAKIAGLTHMTMLLASNMGAHEDRISVLEDAH
ncbi:MAG: hypothetical protein AAF429_03290 [Pseudomonadota bacterium]